MKDACRVPRDWRRKEQDRGECIGSHFGIFIGFHGLFRMFVGGPILFHLVHATRKFEDVGLDFTREGRSLFIRISLRRLFGE